MNLSLNVPTPLEYFAALVQADADFPLLEAAITLGQDEYPDLNVQQALGDVDQLLARLQRRIPADAGSLQRLRALNQFLYRDLNFAGNFNHFTDPDNSYVHVVLRTRLAIPISMAVIWLELAQGVGLKVRGVAFPGYFLVKVHLTEGQVVIDPLNGQSLSREQLAERVEPYRQPHGLDGELEVPLGLYLQAATPRDIIARMLHNLKEIHAAQEDWTRLIAVLDRLIVLLPQEWTLYRDRGLAQAEAGCVGHALEDLDTYLANTQKEATSGRYPDRTAIAKRVAELRKALY
ncbi:transglutaminase-like domain-containing protein [Rhodoferax sp.]|uniref:SirB1 family protein n=1 Tax=Rhodoferax sp. TaxID=50421 RepID=UPI00260C3CBC|nr:transglutaminase-like domain-containing protein [Rhodoferax sp.]MDD5479483.1 transglutaminase-like domain-containing protein [Rhodoferax sp.]